MYRLVGTSHAGNVGDLSHLRAVRTTSAHQFADENDIYAFFMSAKSGDQVPLNLSLLTFFSFFVGEYFTGIVVSMI